MPSTPNTVARHATLNSALPLSQTALLGTYTKPSGAFALIRSSKGRISRIAKGDKVDGASVSAIGEGEVHLVSGGTGRVLTMPKG